MKFHRAISPPDSVDATKVAAALDTGVLKVTLPKQELAQPRTVKVEIGQTNGPIASGRGDPPLVDHFGASGLGLRHPGRAQHRSPSVATPSASSV